MSRVPNAGIYGPPGVFFYHYTTRQAAFEQILSNRTLRLHPLAQMRDPIENQDWVRGMSHVNIPLTGEVDRRAIHDRARAYVERTLILSLSIDDLEYEDDDHAAPYGRGCARPRMWEQYAENHSGVCLVFDRETLDLQIYREAGHYGEVSDRAVAYSTAAVAGPSPARSLHVNDLMLNGNPLDGVDLHVRRYMGELFFTKLDDWRSEREYRYIVFADRSEPLDIDYGAALRAVVVGARFPEWQLPAAQAAATNAGLDLRRITWGASPPRVHCIEER